MRLCGRNALLLGSTGQRQRSTGSCGEGTAPHRAVGWWRRGTWNLDTHTHALWLVPYTRFRVDLPAVSGPVSL